MAVWLWAGWSAVFIASFESMREMPPERFTHMGQYEHLMVQSITQVPRAMGMPPLTTLPPMDLGDKE